LIRMKNLLLILFFGCSFQLRAQSVFSEKYSSRADIKIYVVDHMSSADLIVYKTEYSSQAQGNKGLWYFEEYSSRADKTIFFVDYASQADLKVFFTDYQSQAGWRNVSLKHLMY